MTTVVLGWDGLDYDLLHRYGLGDEFGAEVKRIETFCNGELGKPHTWELWPSIITGLSPDDHGIHADAYIEDNWDSALMRLAARVSRAIPDGLRWRVGRWLRGHGATMAFESRDYYADRGIDTVFDGRRAFPLAIPNYRSGVDERFEISHDRGAELAAYMETETAPDGTTRRTPAGDPSTFAGRIAADCGEKLGLVRHAIGRDYDLVFVWLAYLDTAGHVAPTVDDSGAWMRQAYETAADYTRFIRSAAGEGDTVLCLSDHGLQAGVHTKHACVGAWPADSIGDVGSVVDVAAAIDGCTGRTETPVDTIERGGGDEQVRGRLKNLGYVD